MFRTLANPRDADELIGRLKQLRPGSRRRWGRMNAHQMICHLSDAFVMGTPLKPVSEARGLHNRTIVKWLALYGLLPWPAGIVTRPEINQAIGGTPPGEFASDVATLEGLVAAATSRPGFFHDRRHPIFGALSRSGWLRWGYLHVDHHLRQFGL